MQFRHPLDIKTVKPVSPFATACCRSRSPSSVWILHVVWSQEGWANEPLFICLDTSSTVHWFATAVFKGADDVSIVQSNKSRCKARVVNLALPAKQLHAKNQMCATGQRQWVELMYDPWNEPQCSEVNMAIWPCCLLC